LIDRVDEVCRESELVRAQAERTLRRRNFWPDRRQPGRQHDPRPQTGDAEDDNSPEGADGAL
jgi:hypothetical protein